VPRNPNVGIDRNATDRNATEHTAPFDDAEPAPVNSAPGPPAEPV